MPPQKTKKRKKKFFDVEMPLIAKQTQLQAYDLEELQSRYIKYDLTRILRGKSIEMQFRVDITGTGEGKKAIAIPRKLTLMPYFLRRMVRKGTNYVEDSFPTPCKDAQIRIKPFLIARRKVSRAVRKALRNKAKEELIEYVKDKSTEDIFSDIITNKLQKFLSLKLKKIYPLSLCEIRVLKVEKEFDKKEGDNKRKTEKSEETKTETKTTEEENEEKAKKEETLREVEK